ncbi:MAG: quinolinate synthase NadA [Desulfonatronovibrio sp.]
MHSKKIQDSKQRLGPDLAILAHHYQSDTIVQHADLVGDSLQLAAAIPKLKAKYIVFCGVDFMAETAAVLAAPHQKIFLPRPDATCVMADMAPASLVRNILEKLGRQKKIIPLAYVNSSIGVKALCGQFQGSVCTSANASKMLEWALNQGDQVLFLPDQNLGKNTARLAGISSEKIQVIDVRQQGSKLPVEKHKDQKLLLWPGVCAVHFRLKPENVSEIINDNPQAMVVVHPESHPDVVKLAHDSGSTSKIISFVQGSAPGSTIYVGTEDNLVLRLQKEHPDKNIFPLGAAYCSNMAKTTPEHLAETLENLNPDNMVKVDEDLAGLARTAVETMLKVSAS